MIYKCENLECLSVYLFYFTAKTLNPFRFLARRQRTEVKKSLLLFFNKGKFTLNKNYFTTIFSINVLQYIRSTSALLIVDYIYLIKTIIYLLGMRGFTDERKYLD